MQEEPNEVRWWCRCWTTQEKERRQHQKLQRDAQPKRLVPPVSLLQQTLLLVDPHNPLFFGLLVMVVLAPDLLPLDVLC